MGKLKLGFVHIIIIIIVCFGVLVVNKQACFECVDERGRSKRSLSALVDERCFGQTSESSQGSTILWSSQSHDKY